jgi:thiamine-monophosphate kinase
MVLLMVLLMVHIMVGSPEKMIENMADNEFSIIEQYFSSIGWQSSNAVVLGPGDDCAILSVPLGYELCVSTDTFLSGIHFPDDCSGTIVAQRAFAASLSDLAAMGASTHSFTCALTMPSVDHEWLRDFSSRLSELSVEFKMPLVGGNMTRGPLSLTCTVIGIAPAGQCIRRGGAQAGDNVYVSGSPGDAGAGLALLIDSRPGFDLLRSAYESPRPRIEMGERLIGLASAAIDISDGLLADLGHLLEASQLSAELALDKLPLSKSILRYASHQDAIALALTAGDDYELCFTAPDTYKHELSEHAKDLGLALTCIGIVVEGEGISMKGGGLSDLELSNLELDDRGYQHF